MEEKTFLKQFTQECLQLYDLSPERACSIIYGTWPRYRPDMRLGSCPFKEESYLRYSEAARKEVITAIIRYGNRCVLGDIIAGLVESPNFLHELDLWKDWGVDAGFIRTELDEYISCAVYKYSWLNAKCFAEIATYMNLTLSKQDASDWLCAVKRKFGITSELQQIFEDSITKHTA